eukprot:CAMPEP_0114224566 /NCGR_PEP_ID=MMETSP0058-20121206/177_1 /TAXON_ID=36894 /ORGANISM="Pyramimonas parkeae, CCMP726" /LENGTH=373 /DNA_ID=CAMNT_0001335053 /DNA_START=209 /DNA_END=1330 /DNA_ORIENTATION=-
MGRPTRTPLADIANTVEQAQNREAINTKLLMADHYTPQGVKTAARVGALLEELELEVDARCSSLKAFAQDMVAALRNEFRVQLLKLPKKVRSMPMSEFRDKYAGDINAVLLEDINRRLGGIAANLSEREAGAGNREGNANVDGSEAAVATEAEETFEDAQELLPTTVGRTTRKRGRPPPPVTAAAAAPLPPRTTRRGARGQAPTSETPVPGAAKSARAPAAAMATPRSAMPFTPMTGKVGFPGAAPMATPGMRLTGARVPLNGETLYSQNGSPLGVGCDDVSAPTPAMYTCLRNLPAATPGISMVLPTPIPGARNPSLDPQSLAPSIVITTEDGREVNIAEGENLTEEDKEVAAGRLQGLQNHVALLMKRLMG